MPPSCSPSVLALPRTGEPGLGEMRPAAPKLVPERDLPSSKDWAAAAVPTRRAAQPFPFLCSWCQIGAGIPRTRPWGLRRPPACVSNPERLFGADMKARGQAI